MTFEVTIQPASPAPRLTKIKVFARAGERRSSASMWGMIMRAREGLYCAQRTSHARVFEMSSRAPVSSRVDLFSPRGSVLPRATALVVHSLINGIDLTS